MNSPIPSTGPIQINVCEIGRLPQGDLIIAFVNGNGPFEFKRYGKWFCDGHELGSEGQMMLNSVWVDRMDKRLV